MAQGKVISAMTKSVRAMAMAACVCGASALLCGQAVAQAYEPTWGEIEDANDSAKVAVCQVMGICGGGSSSTQSFIAPPDPCFLAQNAMRPCTAKPSPKGVDPDLAGTWELPFKQGPWVLEIKSDGTYKFHSEAKDGVAGASGTFAAQGGQWSLKAKTGYSDFGDYKFQAPDVFIAAGQHGAVAWLRPDFARRVMRPCDAKQLGTSNPAKPNATVDPHVAGTWELPSKTGGPWVWEISRDGSYAFHSKAMDMATPHAGTFSASNYHWSYAATSGLPGYTDSGLYLFQFPNVLMATSAHLGGGAAWLRPASATCMP